MSVRMLLETGKTIDDIATMMGIDAEVVRQLVE